LVFIGEKKKKTPKTDLLIQKQNNSAKTFQRFSGNSQMAGEETKIQITAHIISL